MFPPIGDQPSSGVRDRHHQISQTGQGRRRKMYWTHLNVGHVLGSRFAIRIPVLNLDSGQAPYGTQFRRCIFSIRPHFPMFINFNTQSIVKWLSQEVSPKTVITDFLVLSNEHAVRVRSRLWGKLFRFGADVEEIDSNPKEPYTKYVNSGQIFIEICPGHIYIGIFREISPGCISLKIWPQNLSPILGLGPRAII